MYSIFLPLSLPPPPSIAAAARRRMQVKALSFLQLRRLDKVADFFSPPPLFLAKKEGQCTHADTIHTVLCGSLLSLPRCQFGQTYVKPGGGIKVDRPVVFLFVSVCHVCAKNKERNMHRFPDTVRLFSTGLFSIHLSRVRWVYISYY